MQTRSSLSKKPSRSVPSPKSPTAPSAPSTTPLKRKRASSPKKPRKSYPVTPDGHYFLVKGTLWRCSNPHLSASDRQHWVDALMNARRDVKKHNSSGSVSGLKEARAKVQEAKEGLGERGPVWWDDEEDGGGTWDRYKAKNTPYRDWEAALDL